MYDLTLTHSERQAIDWIGNRYRHGDELYNILIECTSDEWDMQHNITFSIPQHYAWDIHDIGEDDDFNWSCFCPKLVAKLNRLVASIAC